MSQSKRKKAGITAVCPKCGKKEAVQIIYGYPSFELMEQARKGVIHLGGCVIMGYNPQWYCRICGHKWSYCLSCLPTIVTAYSNIVLPFNS